MQQLSFFFAECVLNSENFLFYFRLFLFLSTSLPMSGHLYLAIATWWCAAIRFCKSHFISSFNRKEDEIHQSD